VTSFADWQRDEFGEFTIWPSAIKLRMLVEKEARLLDQLAFDEMAGDVLARMHLLGAGNAGRRRPEARNLHFFR